MVVAAAVVVEEEVAQRMSCDWKAKIVVDPEWEVEAEAGEDHQRMMGVHSLRDPCNKVHPCLLWWYKEKPILPAF